MGIILTTMLEGIERSHPLLDATTLCGACTEVCPVKVPLTSLLRRLRERKVERNLTPISEKGAMAAFGVAVQSPSLFAAGQRMSRLLWPLLRGSDPLAPANRLPQPVAQTFKRRIS